MVPGNRVKGRIGKHGAGSLKKTPPFTLIGRVIHEVPGMHHKKTIRLLRNPFCN